MSSQPQSQLQEVPDLEPDQLPRRAFFGYDRSTVVDLLSTMSERIRTLVQERAERDRRIAELELEIKRNQQSPQLIGETLIAAREEAKTIREDSRRSAAKVLHSAEKRARRIVADAERAAAAKAKDSAIAAFRERQALIDAARQERQTLLDEAGRARAFVEETHEQLSDFLMAAVKWYEQARPSTDLTSSETEASVQNGVNPDSPANERSSIPSA
jgi:cell division septum initiation protein DivIVA